MKIFDFQSPDIIGKSTVRILSNILEEYCVSITKYFENDLEIPAMSEIKFEDTPAFLPYGENYCEMGAMTQ